MGPLPIAHELFELFLADSPTLRIRGTSRTITQGGLRTGSVELSGRRREPQHPLVIVARYALDERPGLFDSVGEHEGHSVFVPSRVAAFREGAEERRRIAIAEPHQPPHRGPARTREIRASAEDAAHRRDERPQQLAIDRFELLHRFVLIGDPGASRHLLQTRNRVATEVLASDVGGPGTYVLRRVPHESREQRGSSVAPAA